MLKPKVGEYLRFTIDNPFYDADGDELIYIGEFNIKDGKGW